jgi:hypothetical protein
MADFGDNENENSGSIKSEEFCLLSKPLSAFQEGLCPIQLALQIWKELKI